MCILKPFSELQSFSHCLHLKPGNVWHASAKQSQRLSKMLSSRDSPQVPYTEMSDFLIPAASPFQRPADVRMCEECLVWVSHHTKLYHFKLQCSKPYHTTTVTFQIVPMYHTYCTADKRKANYTIAPSPCGCLSSRCHNVTHLSFSLLSPTLESFPRPHRCQQSVMSR